MAGITVDAAGLESRAPLYVSAAPQPRDVHDALAGQLDAAVPAVISDDS